MVREANPRVFSYDTKKGKRYGFHAYLGVDQKTGKKKFLTRQGFFGYPEANSAYIQATSEGVVKKVDRVITMDELFDLWFETYKPDVKESTANKTKETYRIHVKPYFGKYRITEIEPVDFQNYIVKMSKKLLRFKRTINLISSMYKYAISLNLAKENPTLNVIVPRKSERKKRGSKDNFYSLDELTEFLKIAKTVNDRVYLYFLLISSTGARRGEGLALKWEDVDFNNNLLTINKTLTVGENNRQIVNSAKTTKSNRKLPISDNLSLELKKYKLKNGKYDIIFHKALEDDYVSLSKSYQWLQMVYAKAPDELKRITIHGFRHTFASILFESDPNIKPTDVQEMMGHETVGTTLNIYTHMTNKGRDRVTKAINFLNI